MRLNKYIAESGFCSRRKADELISQNRVTINKDTAKLGMEVRDGDIVRIDGEKIKVDTDYEYYLLYKPKKVICTNSDNFARRLAVDFIRSKKRLFTYGRLDYMTEGIILVSNDGDTYNKVMHPRKKLFKTYIAKLDKPIEDKDLARLEKGILIDGQKTAPAKIKKTDDAEVKVSIFEGRNRQIRKMFENLHYNVKELKRVTIGEFKIGNLKPGEYRKLTEDEIEYIKNL
ncbi:Ribosomal large subunit pseudouridine synthase B [Sebaldella termitidis]|jgi:23S rRNA pseudouridine2605 synthase|uniref:Pseudouridine synthase n=1 Tax=Sebaldella termitidis (strain ATCC 33386 / NCTC 11300) TaxID=526218 RepID=D1AH01_SEBTE|nr:pseudouridine synthase [Sebaldella termitidis]ACZ08035.1 RNA-binding S4 domain protein [Sebaldella termitidis ATCC 33386]MBP7980006.1 rRNA pseudouridine synthase [Sebaldella sp.]SUI23336.1 Ribosomal large subunit pseudouridine synthase B [Sebaldella termitidis]